MNDETPSDAARGLRRALDEAVAGYFARTGKRPRGGRRAQIDAVLVVSWFVASYVTLLLLARVWWHVVPLALSMSLAASAVGFVAAHDANHGTLCESTVGNRAWSLLFDVMGISSYVWQRSHNREHHARPLVDGHDPDIDFGTLARLAETQPWRPWHRFQHLYIFVAYGFAYLRWVLVEDVRRVLTGRIGPRPLRRPRGLDLAVLVSGKVLFLGWAVVLPLALGRPAWAVASVGLASALVVGLVLAIVVSLGHGVEGTTPANRWSAVAGADVWCAEQIGATADFATASRIVTWYTGGLNHQVTHHLFSRVAHVHYAALTPIVAEVCARFGIARVSYPTFFAAVAAHHRLLRILGRSTPSRAVFAALAAGPRWTPERESSA